MQTIGKALSLKTRLRFWGNRGQLFFPGDIRRERIFHNQSKHFLQRLNTLHRFHNSKTYTGNTEIPNPPVGNKPTGSVAAGGTRPPGSRGPATSEPEEARGRSWGRCWGLHMVAGPLPWQLGSGRGITGELRTCSEAEETCSPPILSEPGSVQPLV